MDKKLSAKQVKNILHPHDEVWNAFLKSLKKLKEPEKMTKEEWYKKFETFLITRLGYK